MLRFVLHVVGVTLGMSTPLRRLLVVVVGGVEMVVRILRMPPWGKRKTLTLYLKRQQRPHPTPPHVHNLIPLHSPTFEPMIIIGLDSLSLPSSSVCVGQVS